jgi:hypothetical protein
MQGSISDKLHWREIQTPNHSADDLNVSCAEDVQVDHRSDDRNNRQ